jgi:hypothetical protein
MTFEQPACLNHFVGSVAPATWSERWHCMKIFLPIIIFIAICSLEMMGSIMLTAGRFNPWILPAALLPAAFLSALVFTLFGINVGAPWKKPRVLNVSENGISFQAAGRPLIRWKKVAAFWFEDIPGAAELSKITIEYFGDRKTTYPRRNFIVLNNRNQCPALLSELDQLRQRQNLGFRIELNQPLPMRKVPRNAVLSLSLFLAGLLFLFHGGPMLMVSFHHADRTHPAEANEQRTSAQDQKVTQFMHSHFSSQVEFKHFLLETGAVLTLIGIGLMVGGKIVGREKQS